MRSALLQQIPDKPSYRNRRPGHLSRWAQQVILINRMGQFEGADNIEID